jgi:hypothetical protein
MASSFERGAQPSNRLALSLLAIFVLPSSGRICRIAQCAEPHQPIGQLPGRQARGRRAHAALQYPGCWLHDAVAAKPALKRGSSPIA